jgi:hypothetical protein
MLAQRVKMPVVGQEEGLGLVVVLCPDHVDRLLRSIHPNGRLVRVALGEEGGKGGKRS